MGQRLVRRGCGFFVAIVFTLAPLSTLAGKKVCLTMIFDSDSLSGLAKDKQNYQQMAKNNDCRPVVIGRDIFEKFKPKSAAIAEIKRQVGDADEVMMMYSGHGTCVQKENSSTQKATETSPKSVQGLKTRGGLKYRLASAVTKISSLKGSTSSSVFGMVFAEQEFNQCVNKCDWNDQKCSYVCATKYTLLDYDMADFLGGKKVSALIDACGSGCLNEMNTKATDFNGLTSARFSESTFDSEEGGVLNLRISEMLKTSDACYADQNSDGKITFAELQKQIANNPVIPKTYDGPGAGILTNTQAGFLKSTGGASSFAAGTYDRALCKTLGKESQSKGAR